jgi:hypothetical protein
MYLRHVLRHVLGLEPRAAYAALHPILVAYLQLTPRSDEATKRKAIKVALKTIFRLRKERSNVSKKVKVAALEELRNSQYERWLEIGI